MGSNRSAYCQGQRAQPDGGHRQQHQTGRPRPRARSRRGMHLAVSAGLGIWAARLRGSVISSGLKTEIVGRSACRASFGAYHRDPRTIQTQVNAMGVAGSEEDIKGCQTTSSPGSATGGNTSRQSAGSRPPRARDRDHRGNRGYLSSCCRSWRSLSSPGISCRACCGSSIRRRRGAQCVREISIRHGPPLALDTDHPVYA